MALGGTTPGPARISGQVIINELIRNMELGRLELGYSVLVPCIFHVYLHPDDHTRLASVHEIIADDAKRALNEALGEWNRKGTLLRKKGSAKTHQIAEKDWVIDLLADSDGNVAPGDVEIHSELRESPQPGYRGVKTTLLGREPAVSQSVTRVRPAERVFASIRYEDDSGPQTYFVTQEQISVGRGGGDLLIDLPLYTRDEISREHLRIRRENATGTFAITDHSRNGTWVNGRRLKRDVEVPLPDRAEIDLGNVIRLAFEKVNR